MPKETPELPVSEQEVQIQAPNLLDKLKIHKFRILGGILGILVFVGTVFGAYKVGQRQIQPGLGPTPTPEAVATPTPDPTANWKTYIDRDEKFSFKYPPLLVMKDELLSPESSEYTKTFITFISFAQPSGLKPEQYNLRVSNKNATLVEKEDFEYMEGHVIYEIVGREKINLAGKEAIRVKLRIGITEPEMPETVYVDFDGRSLSIRSAGQDEEIFNLMLSAFRFLE